MKHRRGIPRKLVEEGVKSHTVQRSKISDPWHAKSFSFFLREKEHNGHGKYPGARYTETRRPVKMVYVEDYQTRAFAMQREKELKKLNHQQKSDLINLRANY